jgi:hypothetical protein
MEIHSKELIFCQQVQGQMKQAVRMNRVELIDLIDVWRFLFSNLHHKIHDDLRERFEEWRQKRHSSPYQSHWTIYDLASWEIRLMNGRSVRVFDAEDCDQEMRIVERFV